MPTVNQQTTEFLYGRVFCELYTAEGNSSSRREIIVCPKGIRFCYSSVHVIEHRGDNPRLEVLKRGCWSKQEASEGACSIGGCVVRTLPRKRQQDAAHGIRTCCCRGIACNKNTTLVKSPLPDHNKAINVFSASSQAPAKKKQSIRNDISPKETVILGVISSVFATFLILSIVFVSWRCAARKNHNTSLPKKLHSVESAVEACVTYSTISDNDVTLGELINEGAFSTVWKCDYEGIKAAVKIFASKHDSCWRNEARIYEILGVHPNIALILAGVELVSAFNSRKALIMKLYPSGSLLQYLLSHVLNWDEMFKLISSLANGVAFIHGEIDEYNHASRTVIVHRNLNSCNVLVNEDGTCALAGFDFAVHITGQEIQEKVQHGNLLYTPPEVLSNSVNWHDPESSLKQIDVYSLGLIFWEIVRRCHCFYTDGKVPPATVPYVSELGERPSSASIQEHISKQRRRPQFPSPMESPDRSFCLLKNTIEECWDVEPEARLTALCVVKRMQEIQDARYAQVATDNKQERVATATTGTRCIIPCDVAEFASPESMTAFDAGSSVLSLVSLSTDNVFNCTHTLNANHRADIDKRSETKLAMAGTTVQDVKYFHNDSTVV
eukprot:gene3664-4181_t